MIPAAYAVTYCSHNSAILLNTYQFEVEHCSYQHDHRYKGQFYITLHSKNDENIGLVGRIVGPAIHELVFHKLSKLVWTAHYALHLHGQYRANIEIRYTDFDPENFQNATVYRVDNEVVKDLKISFSPSVTKYSYPSKESICDASISKHGNGHWMNNLPEALPAKYLHGPQLHIPNKINNALSYKSSHCRLLNINEVNFEIFESICGYICTVGDSQARHLHNSMIAVVTNNLTLINPPDTNKTIFTILSHPIFKYFSDQWAIKDFHHSECSIVLVGAGQWHAGWPEGYPHSVLDYSIIIRNALLRYKSKPFIKRLLWITPFPHGSADSLFRVPPEDWRNEIVLHAYNNAAIEVCKELNVDYIDIFGIANVLHDLSYDAAHFKAPVAREMALLVLNVLVALEKENSMI
eukprot:gene7329-14949_t